MVRIPTPETPGQPVGTVQSRPANTPFMNVRPADTSQVGRDFQQFGNALQDLGGVLQQRSDDAALREAEQQYYQFEREVLDPQTGIQTRLAGNARGVTAEVQSRMEQFKGELLTTYGDKVSNSGRQALEQYLDSASQRMWKRAASHETEQLYTHENNLIKSGLEAEADRAAVLFADPEERLASYNKTVSLAEDLADRQGLTGVARDQFVEAQSTVWALTVAEGIMRQNPIEAEKFVKEQIENGALDATEGVAWLDKAHSTIVEAKARGELAIANGQAPAYYVADPVAGTPLDTFIGRIIGAESSGRADAVNVNRDGRVFRGLGQVGSARLQDMKNAGVVPPGMSLEEFGSKENEALQREALRWHFKDIDRVIEENDLLVKGYSRDGLRAVAHLGGIQGMLDFATTGMRYNPSDDNETSLLDYYQRFSGADAPASPESHIASIEDPEIRSAAGQLLDQQRTREEKARKRRREQMIDALYSEIEVAAINGQLGAEEDQLNIDQILNDPEMVAILGEDVEDVRDFYYKRQAGEDVVTPEKQFTELTTLRQTDPEKFAQVNLRELRMTGVLSRQDFERFTKEQAAIKGEAAEGQSFSPGQVYDAIRPVTRGMEQEQIGVLEQQMLDFATAYRVDQKRPPTKTELLEHAYDLTSMMDEAEGRVDPAGWGIANRYTGNLTEIMAAAEEEGLQSLLEATEVTLPIPMRDGTFRQYTATPEEMRELVDVFMGHDAAGEFDRSIGLNRAPRPSELLNLIILRESDIIP